MHLLSLISSNQTAYMDKRLLNEEDQLISDILEIKDLLKIKTVDIERAFDSVDHQFLIYVLQTFGFEKNSVRWIKIVLKNQKSSITNGGITTKYLLFQIRKSYTPRRSNICLPIHIVSVRSCICSNQIKSKR